MTRRGGLHELEKVGENSAACFIAVPSVGVRRDRAVLVEARLAGAEPGCSDSSSSAKIWSRASFGEGGGLEGEQI